MKPSRSRHFPRMPRGPKLGAGALLARIVLNDDERSLNGVDMEGSTPPPPTAPAPIEPPVPYNTTSGSPTDFLKGVVGKRVVVRLTSGVDYRGESPGLFLCSLFLCSAELSGTSAEAG